MSKIDKVVLKETKYIAVWVILLSVLMEAVFLIVGAWSYKVLLGNIFSGAISAANFLLMGITVQKAVEKDEKEAKTAMKLSQSLRTLMLFVALVLGLTLPCFNPVAAVIPLFFPRIAIALRPIWDKNINNTDREVKKDGE